MESGHGCNHEGGLWKRACAGSATLPTVHLCTQPRVVASCHALHHAVPCRALPRRAAPRCCRAVAVHAVHAVLYAGHGPCGDAVPPLPCRASPCRAVLLPLPCCAISDHGPCGDARRRAPAGRQRGPQLDHMGRATGDVPRLVAHAVHDQGAGGVAGQGAGRVRGGGGGAGRGWLSGQASGGAGHDRTGQVG